MRLSPTTLITGHPLFRAREALLDSNSERLPNRICLGTQKYTLIGLFGLHFETNPNLNLLKSDCPTQILTPIQTLLCLD
jgi:hypothetical protein